MAYAPFNSDADRINMLRVYLSSARDILRGQRGKFDPETMARIIDRQLATDKGRAAATQEAAPRAE